MSDALEQASLIMVPSGYENGTLGSLKPLDGSGDFTFSRGSDISATRVNEDGYIEKGYENLLTYSNDFSNAAWSGLSKTSGILGYDGTNNAWEITKPAQPYTPISQSVSATGVWTFSLYAKANTLDKISIRNQTDGTRCDFDLLNGVAEFSGSNVISKNISNIGSGWYRCQVTFTGSTSQIAIYVAWNNSTAGSVYIQDAMINQGMVSYPYVETTTAPVAGGILEDMPRLDYSGSCPALLLEPQRTNLVEHSEYFLGAGYNLSSVDIIQSNFTTSAEGYKNASKLTTNQSGSGSNKIENTRSGRTLSIFAKAGEESEFLFFGPTAGQGVFFNLNDGSITGYYQGNSSNIDDAYSTPYNDDWYRFVVVFSLNTYSRIFVSQNQQITFNRTAGNGIYLYGLQADQDATYPTSYIPTYGTSQTRLVEKLADGIDIGSFTSNYNTLFFDWGDMEDKSTFNKEIVRGWSSTDNTTNSFRIVSLTDGRSRYQVYTSAGNSVLYDYTHTTRDKIALVLNGLNSKLFVNGSLVNTYGIDVSQGLRQFNYNGFSRNVTNQFTIFPTALSDDECIALTTIS